AIVAPPARVAWAHDMAGMGAMPMEGFYGPDAMSREASGTSWEPEAARPQGSEATRGGWVRMAPGAGDPASGHPGGPRGGPPACGDNMLMGMAQRPLGPGVFGLRSMLSLEPATIGKGGYPLLLQTGETADGVTPLVDRQHPHDMFMELAGTYR